MTEAGIIKKRISQFQNILKEQAIDFYLVPSEDAHQSEYTATYWHGRSYLSGFDGSAGTLLICRNETLLWTDSRYWLEASKVLKGTGIRLMKEGDEKTPHIIDFLNRKYIDGAKGSVDARVCTIQKFHEYETLLSRSHISFSPGKDLLESVWTDRPFLPQKEIKEISPDFTGESRKQRLSRCKAWLKEHDADFVLISMLDEIAWILNLRGSDVDFNPIFYAYFLVGTNESTLFIAENTINADLAKKLEKLKISLLAYDGLEETLKNLGEEKTIILSPLRSSVQVSVSLANSKRRIIETPFHIWKSQKTRQEISETRDVMVKDGRALACCFYEVQQRVNDSEILNELDVAELLVEKRSQQQGYISESFNAIVGYQDHGAIVHYAAQESSAYEIYGDGVLLIDSGAQYENGTTDITRVLGFGTIPLEAIQAYSLVVKGHIALNNIRFPQGTTGGHLDVLARQYLWQEGKNYGHGTGHGVGFALNVHEGPQRIAPLNSDMPLLPGMIISNEPGYYKEGQFGIRFENLIAVQNCADKPGFLEFECLSLFPLERKLLDLQLLTDEEVLWINSYQEKVWKLLSPGLEEPVKSWLKDQCKEL